MTRKMKIKVAVEWRLRDGKNVPVSFVNAWAYVKKLKSGYKICAVSRIEGKKTDVYYSNLGKFDPVLKSFMLIS